MAQLTKREEIFGPLGITVRTFIDPEKSKRTGVLIEVPDMERFQELMASETAREAMAYDGVQEDTLVMLVES